MRRALLALVIILAVVVDGFFALVNFYPVAPARGPGKPRKVLVSLDGAQARWLNDTLLAEFNVEHDSNVSLEVVPDEALLPTLTREKGSLLLAALPRAFGARAIAAGVVRSFEDVATPKQLAADLDAIDPAVVDAAKVDGKQYFVPRAALLDVMVYRISRVRDAVRHWSLLRSDIDGALKLANGKGLPPGYSLELSPEAWDSYDRFVIAYYWAHRRYEGRPARGRVGHRTGEGLDEVTELIEDLYRAGSTDGTLDHFDSQPVRDHLAWESLYRKHKLFADELFVGPGAVDDDGLLELLRKGDLYLATLNQMQAFTLHGGGHRGTPPKVADPDDLAFAPLPRISSLELGRSGPARPGRPFSFREDWVWALPADGPDRQLAYDLVNFLWQREQHSRECAALGTLPLRKDVMRERFALFELVWMDDIFDAAFLEWPHASPVPERVDSGVGSTYAQLWTAIVANRATAEATEALLQRPPSPRELPHPTPVDTGAAADGGLGEPSDDDGDSALTDDQLWRGNVELERVRP